MTRRIVLVDIGSGLVLSGVLSSAALFSAYSAKLSARGGVVPYTYSIGSGVLPEGLFLDAGTGIISGTTSAPGTSTFTVRVTDLSGAFLDRQFSITVIAEPLLLAGDAPDGQVGTPYSFNYTASGGVPPYVFDIASGVLPAGLMIDADTGALTGTPTNAGSVFWTVRVTDTEGATTITDGAVISYETLALSGTYVAATTGTPYSSDLTIAGGNGAYSNPHVTSGALPAGLSLSIFSDKLRLSGTPTTAATSNFTAAVDSSDGQTATSAQSVIVSTNSDSHWSNVVSLVHFDGINGSTTIPDATGKGWTNLGVVLSTSVTHFGGATGHFDGTSAQMQLGSAPALNIGAGDFTIEAFVNFSAVPTTPGHHNTIAMRDNTTGTRGWLFITSGDNGGRLTFGAFSGSSGNIVDCAAPPIDGAFHHVAAVRSGSTLLLFFDGILEDSLSVGTTAFNDPNYGLSLGHLAIVTDSFLNGYMNDFRFTVGVARYTSDFSVPTSPFPNS